MKINKVGVIAATTFVTSMVGITAITDKYKQDRIDMYKSEMENIDSLRFKRVSDVAKDSNNVNASYNAWQSEYSKMNDSIKKAGIAHKANFDASQMMVK